MQNRQSAGKSYAYLLGVFLGDGCAAKHRNKRIFRLNSIDEDFAIAVKTALESVSQFKVGMSKQVDIRWSKPVTMFQVYCGDNDLCNHFIEVTETKNKIPDFVFSWDIEMKQQFIIGLMDSEGYVAHDKIQRDDCTQLSNRRYFMGFKSCDEWIYDFATILTSVGIKLGKIRTEKPRKDGYKIPRIIYIKMQSWVDSGMRFNIARKNERVDKWNEFGAYEKRAKNPRRRLTSETTCQTAAG